MDHDFVSLRELIEQHLAPPQANAADLYRRARFRRRRSAYSAGGVAILGVVAAMFAGLTLSSSPNSAIAANKGAVDRQAPKAVPADNRDQ